MQIPMEILSLMSTRADSGTSAKQRTGHGGSDGSRFNSILEKTLENVKPQSPTPERPRPPSSDATAEKPQEPDKDACEYAAGVMGNNKDVVTILEGEKDSATQPNMRSLIPVFTRPVQPLITEGTAQEAEADLKPLEADAMGAKVQTDAELSQGIAKYADVETAKPDAASDGNAGAHGEVTARTPITRTSDRPGNEENDSGFLGKGDLSPLENENDISPTKGQTTKQFSDTVAAVRDAAEGAQETVNNTPSPLADGIRPEQFRADQQMKKAALDAPVKAENLFDEMISRLESMQTASQRTMSIQLKPEFLGNVALEIAMDAAGLHVKISAADSGVRAMINGQITALIESLENKGIEVVGVEVAYTGVDNGAFKENREGQSHPNRQKRTKSEEDQADSVTYYSALPIDTLEYYLDAGVSSVEYRA